MSRSRIATTLISMAVASMVMAPNNAQALTHLWGPTPSFEWETVYDPEVEFRPWAWVIAGASTASGYSQAVETICAYASTAVGNIRTGSGCNYGVADRGSILSAPTPHSRGYVFRGGYTVIAPYIAGRSDT